MKEEKKLISLNSKILEVASIEELEERLELAAAPWSCSHCTHYMVGDDPEPE